MEAKRNLDCFWIVLYFVKTVKAREKLFAYDILRSHNLICRHNTIHTFAHFINFTKMLLLDMYSNATHAAAISL